MLFYGKSFAQKSLENKGRDHCRMRSARNREHGRARNLESALREILALNGLHDLGDAWEIARNALKK
jgi:hypothetical protein